MKYNDLELLGYDVKSRDEQPSYTPGKIGV
jgi:hypothetical protein